MPLFQPWASLIAAGAKRVETRSYPPTRFRVALGDRFAVYAAKTLDGGVSGFLDACGQAYIAEALDDILGRPVTTPNDLPRGAIVCTCVLDRASQITTASADELARVNPAERAFGDYDVRSIDGRTGRPRVRWAWVVRDIERFTPPRPATTSHQGAFDWYPDGLPPAAEPAAPAQGVLL